MRTWKFCFGRAPNAAAQDDDFMNLIFLETFEDMETGEPTPESSLAIPLRLSVFITCFDGIPDGIPSKLAESLCTQQVIPFLFKHKIPMRVMSLLAKDHSFNRKFANYVYEGQKEAIVMASNQKCNCCGDPANDLVAWPVTLLPCEDYQFLDGPIISLDFAYPVCEKMECVHLLRGFGWSVKKSDQVEPKQVQVLNFEGSFHYCSKKCQKAHYKVHKKTCEAAKKVYQ